MGRFRRPLRPGSRSHKLSSLSLPKCVRSRERQSGACRLRISCSPLIRLLMLLLLPTHTCKYCCPATSAGCSSSSTSKVSLVPRENPPPISPPALKPHAPASISTAASSLGELFWKGLASAIFLNVVTSILSGFGLRPRPQTSLLLGLRASHPTSLFRFWGLATSIFL